MKVQFLGCGKMGEIILDSFLSNGIKATDIYIKTKTPETENKLKFKYGVNIGINESSNLLILAIKPKQFNDLSLKSFSKDTLIISILAGISINKIKSKSISDKIIRTMPNTPISIGKGVIGYYCNNVINKDIILFNDIFSKTGIIIQCKNEDEIDKITALSGSGPAYYYYFTEILKEKAVNMGFSPSIASLISNNTFIGSSNLLEKSGIDIIKLRENITSPGGTTQKAIETLENNGFKNNLIQAVDMAYIKAKELNI